MVRSRLDCREDRLEDLLAGRLSGREEAELDGHLGDCAGCRDDLEALAAGPSWWSGLRDLGATGSAEDAAPPWPERLGPYLVEGELGRGGMGVVLRAFDPTLNRPVAIKVLAPSLATSAAARRRFAREARAAAAVSHEHVVAIHAVAESPDGIPYLVMPCIAGRSLQERIDAGGPLGVAEILRIGMQAASGLAAAHAQGLVHRDIKPANILLEDGAERVKITDFGLARAVDDASLSQSGVVAGTPQYMAPEQARGEALDARADLFSLGGVLYAMSTGHPPFRAATALGVLRRVCEDSPRPIREVRPEVPDWLAAIVDRLLAKDPARRFRSAAEVADLLGRCLAHVQEPGESAPPYPAGTTPGPARRRARWAVAAAVALVATGLGVAESAGLFAAIIRIKTPEGTLVVDVDDPAIKVALDGKDLVITGPGPQEVRVPIGEHRVSATKDGKPVRDEVVRIARDNKPVVVVRIESDPPAPIVAANADFQAIGDPRPAPLIPSKSADAPASKAGTVLIVPRNYRPEPSKVADPKSAVILAGPEIPGLDQAGALRPVPLDDPSPVPLWPGSSVTYVAYSPDGKTLAVASNFPREILLFDAATRERKATLGGHSARAWCLAFSPDGKQLAEAGGHWGYSADSGEVLVWDLTRPEAAARVVAAKVPLAFAVAFSPDGKTLAYGGWDDLVSLYDLDKGAVRATGKGHEDAVHGLAYSPDGRTIASASSDKTVRLWDAATGEAIGAPFPPFRSGLSHLAFSPDGKLLAAVGQDAPRPGDDPALLNEVAVWDAATRRVVARPTGHAKAVYSVEFSPDGKTMATAGGLKDTFGEVKLWDVATWAERKNLGGFRSWVGSVAFSPDGRTLVACADHGGQKAEVRAWDLAPASAIRKAGEYRPDGTPAWSVAYAPDGKTLAVGGGRYDRHGRVWLRDVASGRADWAYRTHLGVRAVAYSRDGSRLASGSFDGTIAVTDGAGREQAGFRAHAEAINALAIAPDGKAVASASRDGSVKLWDAGAGVLLWDLPAAGEALSLAFSPDGSILAVGMKDGTIATWNLGQRNRRSTLKGHDLGVSALAYAPNGLTLASASWDKTLKLWDAPSSRHLTTLRGHGGEVRSVAFSPDGKTLASGDGAEDGANAPGLLTFWDVAGQIPTATIKAHDGRAWSVAFSPDGKTLASAGEDGLVRFWEVPTPTPAAR